MKSILFDLDGTIGNTLPLCIAAFREALEPLVQRHLTDEDIIAAFGPSEEGTIAMLLPDNPTEGLDRYLEVYARLHPRWPEPFDGMREILSYLKIRKRFVGLVTGKGHKSMCLTLERYGLEDAFDAIKTGDPSGPSKDRRIEEVIREHALDRDDILYVGDAPSDVEVCKACRIKIAAAAWAPTADIETLTALQPDYLFTRVSEFSEFLQEKLN
jgi:phosphoglycolate phosphatase-like HAD superfamily hydrolase